MDLAALAAKAQKTATTDGNGGGGTFLTALVDGGDKAKVPELNAHQANVHVAEVATIKLQTRVAKKRAKNVKRDPKTGLEIKNEWQRDTDIMYVVMFCFVLLFAAWGAVEVASPVGDVSQVLPVVHQRVQDQGRV